MTKTIDIKSHSDYNKIKSETVKLLKQRNIDLMESVINLAVAKEWREWNKTKSEGTIFNFTEQELSEINDPTINELLRLKFFTEDVIKRITKG